MVLIEKASSLSASYDKCAKTGKIQCDGQLVEASPTDAKSREKAKRYEFRVESFQPSTNIALQPTVLAKAGFYYIGSKNIVECYSCGICVEDWSKVDDPFSKKWHSVNCQHINSIGIETLSDSSSLEETEIKYPKDSTDLAAPVCLQSKIASSSTEISRKLTSAVTIRQMNSKTAQKLLYTEPPSSTNIPFNETAFQNQAENLQKSMKSLSTIPPHFSTIESLSAPTSMFPNLVSVPTQQLHSNLDSKQSKTLLSFEVARPMISPAIEQSHVDVPSNSQFTQSTSDTGFEETGNESLLSTAPTISVQEETIPEEELDVNDDYLTASEQASCKSLFKCQNPFSPEMVHLSRRIASFQSVYLENSNLNVNHLALAGFYYLGFSNQVQCWYCGVETSGETSDENPWAEHARLFPTCEYLLRNRGSAFVEAVLLQYSSSRHTSVREVEYPELNFPYFSDHSSERIQSGPERLPTPPIEHLSLTEAQQSELLDESMESEFAQTALRIDFSSAHIRRVIKRQISQHSCNFQSVEALIEALITSPMQELTNQPTIERPSESSSSSQERSESNENSASTSQEPEREASLEIPTPQARSSSGPQEFANEILERIQSEKRCKVCLYNDACILFRPCAHICTCTDCARQLSSCPICRRRVQSSMIVIRP